MSDIAQPVPPPARRPPGAPPERVMTSLSLVLVVLHYITMLFV